MIAEAFHRTGAVEIWGRGTNRVIAECARHGVAPPIFEERQGFVVVTFKAELVARIDQERTVFGDAVAGEEKSREKSKEETGKKSREKILRLIEASPVVTTREIVEAIGLSRSGIEKAIKKLKQERRLKRIGPDKAGDGRW